MKNLIASIFVGLLSGFTVYLIIDNLFERPNKTVEEDLQDPAPSIVYEDDDNTIPLEKSKVGS